MYKHTTRMEANFSEDNVTPITPLQIPACGHLEPLKPIWPYCPKEPIYFWWPFLWDSASTCHSTTNTYCKCLRP